MSTIFNAIRFFFIISLCSVHASFAANVNSQAKTVLDVSGDSNFVSVKNGRFFRKGQAYAYVGVNLWYGAYLASEEKDIGDRARLIKELDTLVSLGVTNVRVLVGSEASELKHSISVVIRDKNGVVRKDILEGLDFLLLELSKRNMTAVLYVSNFWEWSGGFASYVNWVKGGPIVDPSDSAHPWPAFALYSAEFYRNEKAKALYEAYLLQVLNRVNSITGKAYKDDDSIMSWQLANEPRPGHRSVSQVHLPHFYQWISRSIQLIKQHAPKQLVSIGSEGYMGCLQSEACVLDSHKQGADYMTFHMWLKNWGWFDAKNPEKYFDSALEKARAYIKQHQRLASLLKLPLVLEEFGLERDDGRFDLDSSVMYRDAFLTEIFLEIENSVKQEQPLQGSNVWAWGGLGRAEHKDFIWRDGDSRFVGDPPQEAQGLNSIFSSDTSTLALIHKHAKALLLTSSIH